ncbi:MAG TPA: hypothetical protein VGO52_13645 [Hyphomonadaceae bacterium]|jgi:hypothetical protein|nr:hypothetical protein [Hyphomonadaceae bacterium]
MRLIILAASALAFAACSPSEPKPAEPAAAAPAAPAADAHAGMAMDDSMKTSDSKDDANTAETPDGYMFHTYPAKVESVHLPQGNWTATASDTALVEVGAATDEKMPDGSSHHVVKVTPKASGNAEVKFERRDTAAATDPVKETRTIKFMVH